MNKIVACIDGSRGTDTVCDYAAWASLRLEAPLLFLHVLDKSEYPVQRDLSGNIGLGSRESLLQELAELDERRGRLALEQGRLMLDAARERAVTDGVSQPLTQQRHGDLVDTLAELEPDIRLLVIGRQGTEGDSVGEHIGSHLENVVRTMHRPILVTTGEYRAPRRVMLAYDGSATTRKGVEMLASSPLFRGLPCHLVMVGDDTAKHRAQLDRAKQQLLDAGFEAPGEILSGEIGPALCGYRQQHDIDMLIMGAYGHSAVRRFLVGSNTTALIRGANVPLLLLR